MEEKNLAEKVDDVYEFIKKVKENKIKTKDLKLPRKAKVKKSKVRKGYIGVLRIDENMNISGEKIKIEDSSYDLKGGTFHAINGEEILFWNGKFPVVIQPTWSKNPVSIKKEKPNNETYGQKYIMARMLKSVIVKAKKTMNWLIFVIIAVVGIIGYNIFFSGGAA